MASLPKLLGILSLIIISGGCGTYKNVYYNYDKSIDFTQYSSFAWAPDSSNLEDKIKDHTAYDNDIVRNNAKNYITHSMTQRGYVVDIDSPDLILDLVLFNEEKERIITYYSYPFSRYYYYNPFYFPYYYPYYRLYTWRGGWYPPVWDHSARYSEIYLKGSVTINMYDRKQKKLVWTGSAEGNIYDPDYLQYDVHPAIDQILKNFPLKPSDKQRKDINKMVRANGSNRDYNHRSSF